MSLTLAFEGECVAAVGSSPFWSGLGPAIGSDAAVSSESASSEANAVSGRQKSSTLVALVTALLTMAALQLQGHRSRDTQVNVCSEPSLGVKDTSRCYNPRCWHLSASDSTLLGLTDLKDPASLLAAFVQDESLLTATESGCFRVDRDGAIEVKNVQLWQLQLSGSGKAAAQGAVAKDKEGEVPSAW
ncbi:hypothetical protein PRIC1_014423 [Phytophthora ramorum]